MESEGRASRRRIGEDERELFDGLVPPLLRCWVVDKPSGNQSFQQDFSGPLVDWGRVAHCCVVVRWFLSSESNIKGCKKHCSIVFFWVFFGSFTESNRLQKKQKFSLGFLSQSNKATVAERAVMVFRDLKEIHMIGRGRPRPARAKGTVPGTSGPVPDCRRRLGACPAAAAERIAIY